MPTPAQVLTTIRSQINEVTSSFWGDTEIYSYMWQAEHELIKYTKCAEISTSVSTVTDTSQYTLPADCAVLNRLTWYGVKLKKIDLTDYDTIEGSAYGFTPTTGNPVHYYRYGDVVGLLPIPQSPRSLKYFYTPIPSAIIASSTGFTMPVDFAFYIADYCLYRMYIKDDKADLASMHLSIWENSKQKALKEWNERKGSDKYSVVKDVNIYNNAELGMI